MVTGTKLVLLLLPLDERTSGDSCERSCAQRSVPNMDLRQT